MSVVYGLCTVTEVATEEVPIGTVASLEYKIENLTESMAQLSLAREDAGWERILQEITDIEPPVNRRNTPCTFHACPSITHSSSPSSAGSSLVLTPRAHRTEHIWFNQRLQRGNLIRESVEIIVSDSGIHIESHWIHRVLEMVPVHQRGRTIVEKVPISMNIEISLIVDPADPLAE